jgi:hypothetical protein
MKKMRITGESKDGKMLDHVRDVLQFLGFNVEDEGIPHFTNVFLVGIYQDGRLHVDQEHDNVDWSKARQAIIFVYHEETDKCDMLCVSEHYKIHKQYEGKQGFRICIGDKDDKSLSLYNMTDICLECDLGNGKIVQGIEAIWSVYLRDYLGDDSVKMRLLSP